MRKEEHTLKKGQLERIGNNLGHPKRLMLVSEPHHKKGEAGYPIPVLCPRIPYSRYLTRKGRETTGHSERKSPVGEH